MKSIRLPRQRFASPDDVRESRPFYLIVMAVLAGLYGFALFKSVALHSPERLIPFTPLMFFHAVLHWNSPRLAGNLRASVLYLAVQGALVFVLPLIAQADYLVLGLSLALIGEAVGILSRSQFTYPGLDLDFNEGDGAIDRLDSAVQETGHAL